MKNYDKKKQESIQKQNNEDQQRNDLIKTKRKNSCERKQKKRKE